jgi:hypothetical protein
MKNAESKIRLLYRIEGGILDGTELEPIMAFLSVKYPHRKTKDLYIPPIKTKDKETKTWHCCQEDCPNPDFEGGMDALIEHLMIHKGRLLRPWNKKQQLKSPIPSIHLPPNPWGYKTLSGVLEDRRFCLDLYIGDVKSALRKQGLEIFEQREEGK